jgi:hypothetical protein
MSDFPNSMGKYVESGQVRFLSTTDGPDYRAARRLSNKHMDGGTVTLTVTISSLYPGQTARYWCTWIYYSNSKHYFLSFSVLCSIQTFSHFHCKLQFHLELQVINSNRREVARRFIFADIFEKWKWLKKTQPVIMSECSCSWNGDG